MMLDVSYIGNRGSRLNHHWQTLGVNSNMNHPDVLRLGTPVLQSNINSPLAQAAGIAPPYPGFNGNVAQALRMYPQYQNIVWRGVPTGESEYNAFQLVLDRRFSRGLQARFGYTYSRLYNNGAESAQGDNGENSGVQDPANPLEWQRSGDDVPHVILSGFTWEIPGPQSGIARALLGGWNVSGILRYESGRPLMITMDNAAMGGLLFNSQRRPNRVEGTDGKGFDGDFDPFTGNYFNRTAWSDPGPLALGNALRRDPSVRGFPTFSEDVNFFKVFALRNEMRLRFEAQVGNLFDRVRYCDPTGGALNWSSPAFGTVNTLCNTPRSIQFGFRFDF
jgi:hypothetical protein